MKNPPMSLCMNRGTTVPFLSTPPTNDLKNLKANTKNNKKIQEETSPKIFLGVPAGWVRTTIHWSQAFSLHLSRPSDGGKMVSKPGWEIIPSCFNIYMYIPIFRYTNKHVYIFACIHICIYTSLHIGKLMKTYYVHTYTHFDIPAEKYICTCIYRYKSILMLRNINIHACIHVHLYLQRSLHKYIYF